MKRNELVGIRFKYFTEYRIYCNVKYRCNTSTAHNYLEYGGRGIQCMFKSFEEFLQELGPRPTIKHSIERLDNNGHYEVGNVKWATRTEQRNNQRQYSIRSDNSSGIPGISYMLKTCKWRTRVFKNKKEIMIYYGPSKQEAIDAKILWEKEQCLSY